MAQPPVHDPRVAEGLILDELFDLRLYTTLRDVTTGSLQTMLGELVRIETTHVAFWQDFFKLERPRLDPGRRVKLAFVRVACRLFGARAVHLVLEAIEVYGIRKYLSLWETYKDTAFGDALRKVLQDELQHEDAVVTAMTQRKINPERIRNIFLGLNDGLVEIVGAVSGFFAAFGDPVMVLVAASTTAVAGSLSMAAGAYVASSSEHEVARTELGRRHFLGEDASPRDEPGRPLTSATLVGASYFAGALVPVLPVLFGARNALISILAAGALNFVVSLALAFLSGMEIRKRVVMNLVIVAAAVGVTYLIGLLAKTIWGIAV